MPIRFRWLCVLLLGLPAWSAAGDDGRGFVAVFEDGAQVQGDRIRGWDRHDKPPVLQGRRLDDPGNPVRFITRRGAEAASPEAYLRFRNGDVLVGRISAYEPGLDGRPAGGVLLVDVNTSILLTHRGGRQQVAVWAEHVTQVVCDAARAVAPPGAGVVRFADGREVAADAIGWRVGGVRALSGQGVINAGFDDLGAVTLPAPPAPEVLGWADRSDPRGLLATAQLADGSRLTAVVGQLRAESGGRRGTKEGRHRVQPEWAVGLIGYDLEDVVGLTVRRREQVPLSRFASALIEQRNSTGYVRAPQIDRSVGGGPLRVGRIAAAYGVGMHARATLAFELPASAKAIRGHVGIDDSVGNGGCAIAAVFLNKRPRLEGEPAWRSNHLRGAQDAVRFGPIDLGDRRHVLLHAGDGHDDRPKGADPLDIRDHVDWLAPTVTLDTQPAPRTLAGVLPNGEAWRVTGAEHLAVGAWYNKSLQQWSPTLHTDKAGVGFETRVEVGPAAGILDLQVRVLGQRGDQVLTVTADGKPLPQIGDDGKHDFTKARDGQQTRFLVDLTALGPGEHDLRVQLTQPRDRPALDTPGLAVEQLAIRPIIEGRPNGLPLRPDTPLLSIKPHELEGKTFPQVTPGKRSDGTPVITHGRDWPGALVLPQSSGLGYNLPTGATRFVAVLGPDGDQPGPRLVVIADGSTLFDGRPPGPGTMLQQLELDLPPDAKRLELRTDRGDTHAILLDPGLMLD